MNEIRTRALKTVGWWVVLVFFVSNTHAAVFTVDRTDDNPSYSTCNSVVDNDCSLRGAITAANEFPGADYIVFDLEPNPPYFVGILFLSVTGNDEDDNLTGDLDITEGLTIDGGGWISISGASLNDRVLHIRTTDPVALQDITISDGTASTNGGGIAIGQSDSDLSLTRVTVKNNHATYGGGLSNWYSTVTIVDSLFTGNTVDSNNSAIQSKGGFVVLYNSTISGNGTVENPSAAVSISDGGQFNNSFSTIVNNVLAPSDGASIVVNNSEMNPLAAIIEGECTLTNSPTVTSMGASIESPGDTCQLDPATDHIAVPDLGLLPLGDYGGPTLSHLPLAVSPAIDDDLQAIPVCPDFDQRGLPRNVDGDGDSIAGCDSGAVELQPGGLYILIDDFESGGLWRWSLVTGQ